MGFFCEYVFVICNMLRLGLLIAETACQRINTHAGRLMRSNPHAINCSLRRVLMTDLDAKYRHNLIPFTNDDHCKYLQPGKYKTKIYV